MTDPAARPDSVMTPQGVALADVYAQAALDLLTDDTQAQQLAGELEQLVGLLDSIEGFEELLLRARLSVRQRAELVDRLFSGRCSATLEGLLGVLARHGRLELLRGLAARYRKMLNRRQGKIEVLVTTARPMSQAQLSRLQQALDEMTGREALIESRVDGRLLGGLTIRVGDRLIDSSVASQLRRLGSRLGRQVAGKP